MDAASGRDRASERARERWTEEEEVEEEERECVCEGGVLHAELCRTTAGRHHVAPPYIWESAAGGRVDGSEWFRSTTGRSMPVATPL